MKLPPLHCRSAIAEAAALIRQLQIESPAEIDVELIANHCNALVVFKPLKNEEGHLVRAAQNALIVVDEEARQWPKWRFIVAHELGHLRCHQGLDQFDVCTDTDLHDWYKTSGHESAANHFAAELLMPEPLFKPQCDVKKPSLDTVITLGKRFNTSVTSSALRFVQFCPEPVAVVYSEQGRVLWSTSAEGFKVWLTKGQKVTTKTYAGDIFAGRDVPEGISDVSVDAWNTGQFTPAVELYEHSMKLGHFDAVLTLLWHAGV